MCEWIKVSDKMPPYDTDVFICDEGDKRVFIGHVVSVEAWMAFPDHVVDPPEQEIDLWIWESQDESMTRAAIGDDPYREGATVAPYKWHPFPEYPQ